METNGMQTTGNIKEQCLYVIEPCRAACAGCFLDKKETSPIEEQFSSMPSHIPTVITLNDRPADVVRENIIAIKGKFSDFRIHCTSRTFQDAYDLHDRFTCSISTKLKNYPVQNQEVMLTIYPGDSIEDLKKILVPYEGKGNSIVVNFTKPWTNFKAVDLMNYIIEFKQYRFDECTMYHLLGTGICIAQKGTANFYTEGEINKCPYYMDDICEPAVLVSR